MEVEYIIKNLNGMPERERKMVLDYTCRGKTTKQIAKENWISERRARIIIENRLKEIKEQAAVEEKERKEIESHADKFL